jgi:hypothetical protein
MTYDPVLNLRYIGVHGPWPWSPTDRGADRGDELFTDSIGSSVSWPVSHSCIIETDVNSLEIEQMP